MRPGGGQLPSKSIFRPTLTWCLRFNGSWHVYIALLVERVLVEYGAWGARVVPPAQILWGCSSVYLARQRGVLFM